MQPNQLTTIFILATTIAAVAIAADVPSRKDAVLLNVTATVEAIDQKTREVTLKGPMGNSVTFIAGPDIKRLDEIHVGDEVNASYYLSFAAELREPTAEEKAKPLTILDVKARATEGEPAGAHGQRIKAVTTIEGIDRSTQTITVKGPRGRYVTARVERPEVLEKMQIGNTIVITYTEAIGMSLEKCVSKAKD